MITDEIKKELFALEMKRDWMEKELEYKNSIIKYVSEMNAMLKDEVERLKNENSTLKWELDSLNDEDGPFEYNN